MSTASKVPETSGSDGASALATLRDAKVSSVLRDSVARLRLADGLSHSRAMAYQLVVALIPGMIVVVAVAAKLHWDALSEAIVRFVRSLAPGPAGDVFEKALGQGAERGRSPTLTPIVFGGLAFVLSGTTVYGQIERAANRIYGSEADRPAVEKYRRAASMMLTSGVLTILGFAILGLGGEWFGRSSSAALRTLWLLGRWPVGAALLTAAFTLIFQLSPRRRQPHRSWLVFGAVLAVGGVIMVSVVLHLYLRLSKGFGETYGPLAGFIGVLLWAYLSSIVLFLGLAFAAQLEAVRAGRPDPRRAGADPDSS